MTTNQSRMENVVDNNIWIAFHSASKNVLQVYSALDCNVKNSNDFEPVLFD